MTDSPTSADVATIDSFLELGHELGSILRAHGIDAPLTAHDAAKRLIRFGFRIGEPPELSVCRGNAEVGKGCGEMAVLGQGVCLNCLTRHQRSLPVKSADAELERALDELGGRAGHATWCQASGLAIDEECNCGHDNECDAKSIVRALFASQTTERDHWKDVADTFIRIGVNRGPLRGGVEFYINEEWRIALENHLCSASLYTTKFDPDDEPVRVRPIADDDALLLDASRTLTPEEALAQLTGRHGQNLAEYDSGNAKLRLISEGKA